MKNEVELAVDVVFDRSPCYLYFSPFLALGEIDFELDDVTSAIIVLALG